MKKVLRESLWLLSAGQYASWIDSRERSYEVSLGYADFGTLRPEYSASSWRGAMAKAIQNHWVAKRYFQGEVRFQLTKYGQETVKGFFEALKGLANQRSQWGVLLIRPQGERQEYSKVRRFLQDEGWLFLSQSTFLSFQSEISSSVLTGVAGLGFSACLVPFDPSAARPHSLSDWLQRNSQFDGKSRALARISRDVDLLINDLEVKKSLHTNQKQRVGSLVVSGLSLFESLTWYEITDLEAKNEFSKLLAGLDQLFEGFER